MEKKEALVDTVFLQELSVGGKDIGAFKRVIEELDFKPVIHPYVTDHELDMYGYVQRLIDEGYIRKACYEEFLMDDADRSLYALYFHEFHDELRKHLEALGRKKQLMPLILPKGIDIFHYRKAGMSLGDVHMILMASFLHIPVILSDDSDLSVLQMLARRKFSYSGYDVEIYGCVEVLKKIAEKANASFTKKELIDILKNAGKAKEKSVINKIWNESRGVDVSKI